MRSVASVADLAIGGEAGDGGRMGRRICETGQRSNERAVDCQSLLEVLGPVGGVDPIEIPLAVSGPSPAGPPSCSGDLVEAIVRCVES